MPVIIETIDGAIATITLNDPHRRNALGSAMFAELERALASIGGREAVSVLLLRGRGPAFCAGFDLREAADRPELVGQFILRLSGVIRAMRGLPQVVVAAVHGPAIAGGCALVSASDLVVVAPEARIGYPVHRLGISPAVSLPTLQPAIGPGAARWLQLSGELIDGARAHRIGLASHLSDSARRVTDDALSLCRTLADHGPRALRATKAWLNELDGSLDDHRFASVAAGTAKETDGEEAVTRLRALWASGRRPRQR